MNLIFLRNWGSILSFAILIAISSSLLVPAKASETTRSNSVSIFAQTDPDVDVEPGRTTRSGSSYVGIGGNIGLTGDTAVGEEAFTFFSKIGLTRSFSARPSVLINGDAAFLIPITIDFTSDRVPLTEFRVAPYVGGGLAIATGDDSSVGGLITAGLDIPISSQFTANTSVNVNFIDDTDVGLQLGIGLNF
jgi:hypothetical protein